MSLSDKLGIFRVEDVIEDQCRINVQRQRVDCEDRLRLYIARVVDAIHGLKAGDRIVFTEGMWIPTGHSHDRDFDKYPYPKMHMGKEYFIHVVRSDSSDDATVRALGFTDPIATAASSKIIRTDAWRIREILPQLRGYAAARFQRDGQVPAAVRNWALANLGTRHPWLKPVLEQDLAMEYRYYAGASRAEAVQLARHSDTVEPQFQFSMLQMLAQHTDLPMDFWFLRAVSKREQSESDDLHRVFDYHHAIYNSAKKLSIEVFWPFLMQKTDSLSEWVGAFAQKADPRLLPIILRHMQPGKLEEAATRAMSHYRGKPEAARALIEHLKVTNDLGKDAAALEKVREALEKIGTPDALAEAGRLRRPGTVR